MLALPGRHAKPSVAVVFAVTIACGCGKGFEDDPPAGPSANGWSTSFGDAATQTITAVAVDAMGGVYVTGGFLGFTDFGDGAKEAAGQSEDVFVAKYDTDGNHIWSRRFGDNGNQRGTAIAVGIAGDVIISGTFNGSIDIAGDYLSAVNGQDAFIMALGAADGEELWGAALSGMGNNNPTALSVDRGGNIVLAGVFNQDINLGGELFTTAGLDDIFVAKMLPAGELVWARRYGDVADDYVADVATDSDGDVVLTGYLRGGAVDFGGGPLDAVGIDPNDDAFIVALAPDGAHRWSKRLGDEQFQRGLGVAFDADDNALAIGYFAGTIDFGGESRTSSGQYDTYAAKLDPMGAPIWTRRYGVMSNQYGQRIDADPSGGVFLTGDFEGVVEFGGQQLDSAGGRDIYIARLDGDAQHRDSRSFGDAIDQSVSDAAVDASGNAVIVGNFYGTVDFGFGPHATSSDTDLNPFIAKLVAP